MASDLDTLNIGQIRLKKEYPVAEVQPRQVVDPIIRPVDPVLHPDAAAAARARIAAIGTSDPIANPEAIPATPTAELILDKTELAKRETGSPMVSRAVIPSAARPLLTAIGIFLLVLLLFKAPIILSQIGYSLGKKPAPAASTAPAVTDVVPAANTISIPKINVQAPVQYEPSIQEAAIQTALQSGVVHYGNTAFPGQAGNVAIFGHSSNDWWEPGNFKFVFVLLDKLAPGDQVSIDYNSQRYTYEVTGSRVVDPTDVGVLAQTTDPTLTLITCTPPGTSLRRLVVTAKQISPDPKKATAVASAPVTKDATNLPSSAPSFMNQVTQAWNGIVQGMKSLFGGDTGSVGPTSSPGASPATTGEIPAVK